MSLSLGDVGAASSLNLEKPYSLRCDLMLFVVEVVRSSLNKKKIKKSDTFERSLYLLLNGLGGTH